MSDSTAREWRFYIDDMIALAEKVISDTKGYREYLETSDLLTLSMRLADTPCSPIKYDSPARLIREIVSDSVR